MPAKPDTAETAPETAAPDVVDPGKAPSGAAAWIPAICAVVLAPVLCVAVVQFILVPRFQKKLGAAAAVAVPAAAAAPEPNVIVKGGSDGKQTGAGNSFDFTNVVVNLSGTMGTRYLKTSFTVTGNDPGLKQAFDSGKARLTDVTLNVLSALSLAELEEPGSKNVLRDRLVTAYNQALGHHTVDQVYFSDFLIQ